MELPGVTQLDSGGAYSLPNCSRENRERGIEGRKLTFNPGSAGFPCPSPPMFWGRPTERQVRTYSELGCLSQKWDTDPQPSCFSSKAESSVQVLGVGLLPKVICGDLAELWKETGPGKITSWAVLVRPQGLAGNSHRMGLTQDPPGWLSRQ